MKIRYPQSPDIYADTVCVCAERLLVYIENHGLEDDLEAGEDGNGPVKRLRKAIQDYYNRPIDYTGAEWQYENADNSINT